MNHRTHHDEGPEEDALHWPETFPASVTGLDIRHHALLEASAGTGKTYAIEHLVMRILLEDTNLKPEEILLLSFTEKTAADLRKRIRERLQRECTGEHHAHWTPAQRARLHQAWLHADDLAIHTIHGFCHAALLRDPIANDALLRPDVVDDRAVAHDALETLMRGPWARDPGRLSLLREALDINAGDWWRDKLIGLALSYQPGRGDRLEPPPDGGAMPRMRKEIGLAFEALRAAHRRVCHGDLPVADYLIKLPESKRGGNPFGKVDAILTESRDEIASLRLLVETFYGKYVHGKEKKGKTKAHQKGFSSELDATRGRATVDRPEWVGFANTCTAIVQIGLRFMREEVLELLRLTAEAADELRAELAREKKRRGAISYDDMTQNLADALVKNTGLAARLRRAYKFCLVDEFQDTDQQQWSILQALCLDGDDASPPAVPLFLVGDPKQAIYSFRGGDLKTYLAARDRLRKLAESETPRAQGIGLTENFRSRPALLDSLNAVFERTEWFGAADPGHPDGAWRLSDSREIVFTRVRAGGAASTQPAATGPLPLLRVRDFRPSSTDAAPPKRKVERALRDWIVARVLDLTAGRTDLRIVPKHETLARPPRFGDIAILVRRHSEADALEKLLRRHGIPCRVRRTGGVFHGEGADALRLLLDFMPSAGSPETQARILLLPFLRRPGTDWPEGRPTTPPPLVLRWMELAQAGRWPEFFDAVLRESGHLARVAEESESAAARLLALGRALGEAGSTPGTSVRALADRFDALRRGEGDGEEGVIGEDDGEGEKEGDDGSPRADHGAITVMTLHMSKGLEFPVVFVAATGAGRRPDFYTVREDHGFRHVLDKQDADAKARHLAQAGEEDKRLFYVAFTRARDCLYVPILPAVAGNTHYGPLGDFAALALSALPKASETSAGSPLILYDEAPVPPLRATAGNARAGRTFDAGRNERGEARPTLTPTETARLFDRIRRLNSYSALARRTTIGRETPSGFGTPVFGGEGARAEELLGEDGKRSLRDETPLSPDPAEEGDSPGPASWPAALTREDLPPGAAAGNVLHNLLEATDFSSALKADSPAEWLLLVGHREQAENLLRREGLDPAHSGAVARAVWNTLRMPIPDPARPGTTFRLSESESDAHLHEVEFLFPALPDASNPPGDDAHPWGSAPGLRLEGTEQRGHFLWGFIDLVFRHEGRYYLLDWKSNLLDTYDSGTVEAAMKESGYDLQWQLYAVALDRWLSARVPEYDPARDFGGIVYAYMRGAAPGLFSGYTYRPSVEELRRVYPERLKRLLGIAGVAP